MQDLAHEVRQWGKTSNGRAHEKCAFFEGERGCYVFAHREGLRCMEWPESSYGVRGRLGLKPRNQWVSRGEGGDEGGSNLSIQA